MTSVSVQRVLKTAMCLSLLAHNPDRETSSSVKTQAALQFTFAATGSEGLLFFSPPARCPQEQASNAFLQSIAHEAKSIPNHPEAFIWGSETAGCVASILTARRLKHLCVEPQHWRCMVQQQANFHNTFNIL